MEQAGVTIAIVSSVFGGMIVLLLYIWNMTQKNNDKRHEASEKRHEANENLISKLTDITVQQGNLLAKLDAMIEHHEKRLDKVK